MSRYIAIWFQHLKTDWMVRQHPELKDTAFALVRPDHGRIKIAEVSAVAYQHGIFGGMVATDAKIILPSLHLIDDDMRLEQRILKKLCLWAIRYTPSVSADLPDGLILDVSGCAHLWQGEKYYLEDIISKLSAFGYHIKAAMADTIGMAWAASRYGKTNTIIPSGTQKEQLALLPPAALRLETAVLERLYKLGFYRIGSFIDFNRPTLRRRFGPDLIRRLDQALGIEEEKMIPVQPVQPYEERLPCFEPIMGRKGIEIALCKLLEQSAKRLKQEGKGIRKAVFQCFRIDGRIEKTEIATNRPSIHTEHLFKLFEIKLGQIEPALGIDLFLLTATVVQELKPLQPSFWAVNDGLESDEVSRLLDRIQARFGSDSVKRYLPAGHHMPERSCRPATSLSEKPSISWPAHRRRPIQLLPHPEKIIVTAPIPDYPPMNFTYRGKLHIIKKADGPERIEPEWWLEAGLHRDYYVVEDEEGKRYWLFRAGHYREDGKPDWFLHGFFS